MGYFIKQSVSQCWSHLENAMTFMKCEAFARMERMKEYGYLCRDLALTVNQILKKKQNYYGDLETYKNHITKKQLALTKEINSKKNSFRYRILQVAWKWLKIKETAKNAKRLRDHISHDLLAEFLIFYLVFVAYHGLQDGHFLKTLLSMLFFLLIIFFLFIYVYIFFFQKELNQRIQLQKEHSL